MARASYGTYFHDITYGYNGYFANPGYDLVTGLGSPQANAIVQGLVHVSGAGSSLTITASTATTSSAKTTANTQVTTRSLTTTLVASAPPGTTATIVNLLPSSGTTAASQTTVLGTTAPSPVGDSRPALPVTALLQSQAQATTPAYRSLSQESGGGENAILATDQDEDGGEEARTPMPAPQGQQDDASSDYLSWLQARDSYFAAEEPGQLTPDARRLLADQPEKTPAANESVAVAVVVAMGLGSLGPLSRDKIRMQRLRDGVNNCVANDDHVLDQLGMR
jgi:hypothetical protein